MEEGPTPDVDIALGIVHDIVSILVLTRTTEKFRSDVSSPLAYFIVWIHIVHKAALVVFAKRLLAH